MSHGERHTERGAAVLEGALVLLILFTLVFGIWEAGRLFNVQEVVTNAAREGARFAVAPITQTSTLPSDTEIETHVNIFLQSAAIRGVTLANGGVQINDGNGMAMPTVISGNEFTRVRVTVNYAFLTLPLLGDFTATLAGEAMMRNETSP